MPNANRMYPRSGDTNSIYLKNAITDPAIEVGDFTVYNDFVNDPRDFEKNNILYHYPINHDRLIIGKCGSIACGARFIMNGANHAMSSLSTFVFPLFADDWSTQLQMQDSWENKGDTVIGSDVWIGYEAVILPGVQIRHGAIVTSRALVSKDIEPFTIVGGIAAKPIKKRFDEKTIDKLLEISWWDWPAEKVQKHLEDITSGNIDAFMKNA
ncbi:CatB-related O-acetyltransferase [Eubacterium maltosivorans]|uniref:CatB-related O-acetyltransferase n=1 Tax=Eubacterium maltosivorans TaxID=2041044 RepID=UPI00189E6438|nr:CatB-related O-acetyltransferase [Eubacterium maltosivorans]